MKDKEDYYGYWNPVRKERDGNKILDRERLSLKEKLIEDLNKQNI